MGKFVDSDHCKHLPGETRCQQSVHLFQHERPAAALQHASVGCRGNRFPAQHGAAAQHVRRCWFPWVAVAGEVARERCADFYDQSKPLYIVKRPDSATKSKPLLLVRMVQADRRNPEFADRFRSTEQHVTVDAQPIVVNAHREALMEAQRFALHLQHEVQKMRPTPPADVVRRELSVGQAGGLLRAAGTRGSSISLASFAREFTFVSFVYPRDPDAFPQCPWLSSACSA